MKLPNASTARIDRSKIVAYLLSAEHPDGRSKAVFFGKFGFSGDDWEAFAASLREHAVLSDVSATVQSRFGTRYTVTGSLRCPDGRAPRVSTVWILEAGESAPRLITAFPA